MVYLLHLVIHIIYLTLSHLQNGTIVTKGDSKAVDYVAEVKKLLANGGVAPLESAPAGGALALDEDF